VRVLVLGGGISGLATAQLLAARGRDVTLLDDGAIPGGLIASVRRDGFLCEHGPQAVLDGAEETRALVAAAGLTERAVRATAASRRRFVYVDGALRPFPSSPPGLFKTNLFGAGAKLRLFWEPFVRRRADAPDGDDESVEAFVARRFGPEAARRAAGPALIGVFAGDASALSIRAALPRVYDMERAHGSVIRALFRGRRGGGGMGKPFSFPEGLAELPTALAAQLGARRVAGRAVAIERIAGGTGWRVDRDGSAPLEADRLVLATPAVVTADLLAPHAPAAAEAMRAIPHAPVAVVCLGFKDAGDRLGMDLDAYGFVAARGEGVKILGCQYDSSVFPGRAPAGSALLRVLMGGVFDPSLLDADDGAIAGHAIADLRRAAGLAREPDLVDVWRVRPGIPQYTLGHGRRVAAVDQAIASLPGLTVIGHALRGVGITECIRTATRIASET
jgi:oxygen-dependent protoporphyrinogen oxidase